MTFSERKRLAAFQSGDARAFDALFYEYAGRVQAFARSLTGNRAEAEDLTQEVFSRRVSGRGTLSRTIPPAHLAACHCGSPLA